jgi:hypothetical protein
MSQPETVIVITKDLLFRSIIERLLGEKRQLFFFREFAGAIDVIYNTQPHLIIIDLQADDAALVRPASVDRSARRRLSPPFAVRGRSP